MKPTDPIISFRIDLETRTQLEQFAVEDGVTLSELIRNALYDYVYKKKKKRKVRINVR